MKFCGWIYYLASWASCLSTIKRSLMPSSARDCGPLSRGAHRFAAQPPRRWHDDYHLHRHLSYTCLLFRAIWYWWYRRFWSPEERDGGHMPPWCSMLFWWRTYIFSPRKICCLIDIIYIDELHWGYQPIAIELALILRISFIFKPRRILSFTLRYHIEQLPHFRHASALADCSCLSAPSPLIYGYTGLWGILLFWWCRRALYYAFSRKILFHARHSYASWIWVIGAQIVFHRHARRAKAFDTFRYAIMPAPLPFRFLDNSDMAIRLECLTIS